MQADARPGRREAATAHPLAELLACPPDTGTLLNNATRSLEFHAGEVVFRQSEPCCGLYVLVSGRFLRKAERFESRLVLGPSRPGELVELSAALGREQHTYTLLAQSVASVLMLPLEALDHAFRSYPPLEMHLLEELAREVSRAYNACSQTHAARVRRRSVVPAQA